MRMREHVNAHVSCSANFEPFKHRDASECSVVAAGRAAADAGLRGSSSSRDGGGRRAGLPLDWMSSPGGSPAGRARKRSLCRRLSL